MAVLQLCFELHRLPGELEQLTTKEIEELLAYLYIRRKEEEKMMAEAKRGARKGTRWPQSQPR